MAKAWVENNVIRDVCAGDPFALYHPDIAAHYVAEVPENVSPGWVLVNDVWVAPEPAPAPAPAPAPVLTECSPVEFLLRIPATRRVAIRQSTNPAVQDWLKIIEHPSLTVVHFNVARPAIDFLVTLNLLTAEEADQICPV